jgi:hypothetical protein
VGASCHTTTRLTSAQEEIKRVHDNMQNRLQTEVYQLGIERDNAHERKSKAPTGWWRQRVY